MNHKIVSFILFCSFLLSLLLSQIAAGADYNGGEAERHRLMHLWHIMMHRNPAPQGCASIGIWEDGSQMAYCVDTGTYITHGPEKADSWSRYPASRVPTEWQDRAACLDGQSSSSVDCKTIVAEMPQSDRSQHPHRTEKSQNRKHHMRRGV